MKKTASISCNRLGKAFTLLELLIVVAILALVGGLVIVAYEGLLGQAAKATSANTISSLSDAVRSYQILERALPDDMDTLVAVGVNTATTTFDPLRFDNQAVSYNAGIPPILTAAINPQLAARLILIQISLEQRLNLQAAGIDTIRYLDVRGEGEGGRLDLRGGSGLPAEVGPVRRIDIPSHLFDAPMPGMGANRGRGFSLNLRASQPALQPHLASWNSGEGGYENVKLGAPPTSTLIVLGIGKNCSLVNAAGDVDAVTTNARLATAPFFGDVAKGEYPNYLLVIDVDQRPARFITVIDPTGGFQAENYAASRGQ